MARLSKLEQAARDFCERLPEYEQGYAVPFRVVWVKSRTWGNCPSVETLGEERLAYVKGCGFDKLSAGLSQVLRFLPGLSVDERRGIERANSAGLASVVSACAAAGWELRQVYSGKAEDGFTIRRTPPARFAKGGECLECLECRRLDWTCPDCQTEGRPYFGNFPSAETERGN